MRILDGCSEFSHVKVAAEKKRPPQPLQPTAADLSNIQFKTVLGEAILAIVCRRINRYRMALLLQGFGQSNDLPFTTAFDKKFMDDKCDLHGREPGLRFFFRYIEYSNSASSAGGFG